MILLGRTGLEAALRTDPGIELLRARTPLEVIGELTQPGETMGRGAVVVVAPQVDGLLEHAAADEVRIREFVSALRVADPTVVVLAVQNGTASPTGFDGLLRSDLGADQVRAAVRWKPGTLPGQAVQPTRHVPLRPPTPALPTLDPAIVDALMAATADEPEPGTPAGPVTQPVPPPVRDSSPGDSPIVALLLQGQDPLPAAVAVLRERLSDPGLEFVPPSGEPAPDVTPVAWEGMVYGGLKAPRAAASALPAHARWLAGWLRLRDQQTQLRQAAFTDPLTGAWNRRYFDRFLSSVIERARSARRHVTVLVFDIDDFKKYNDLYGHDAGDEILRETVRLLRSVIRPTDRVCRVGGDEFAVIFNEPEGPRQEGSRHPQSVFDIAHRFQQQVLRHQFPKLLACAPGTLTISGGLATFPWDGTSPAELLSKADQLAMASKRQGKNAITIGPGAMRLLEE